jgi:hypothetical protein
MSVYREDAGAAIFLLTVTAVITRRLDEAV